MDDEEQVEETRSEDATVSDVVADKEEAAPTLPDPPGMAEIATPSAKAFHALERRNKELLVRVRKLELDRMKTDAEDGGPSAMATVSEEAQGILSVVKDLEAELDNAFTLKEALEADLATLKVKLKKETAARGELQAQVRLLEAQASLVEQLRDELSFVEEERTEIARKLGTNQAQLSQVTNERDSLAQKLDDAEARASDLEQVRVDLEAQVLNLKEGVARLGKTRTELVQAVQARDTLVQQVNDLSGRLDVSETSKRAFELDLITSQEVGAGLQKELDEQTRLLEDAEINLAELRAEFEELQFQNSSLTETNNRLKRDLKTLGAKHETVSAELDASRRALREIHGAATRTTQRVLGRYYEASETKTD